MNTPNKRIVPSQPPQPTQPSPLEQVGVPIEELKDFLALHGAGKFGRQVKTQLRREVANATVSAVNTLIGLVILMFILGGIGILGICLSSVPHTEPHSNTHQEDSTMLESPAINPDLSVTLYWNPQTGYYSIHRAHSYDLQQNFSEEQARQLLQKGRQTN
jgi:hypothetical protein